MSGDDDPIHQHKFLENDMRDVNPDREWKRYPALGLIWKGKPLEHELTVTGGDPPGEDIRRTYLLAWHVLEQQDALAKAAVAPDALGLHEDIDRLADALNSLAQMFEDLRDRVRASHRAIARAADLARDADADGA